MSETKKNTSWLRQDDDGRPVLYLNLPLYLLNYIKDVSAFEYTAYHLERFHWQYDEHDRKEILAALEWALAHPELDYSEEEHPRHSREDVFKFIEMTHDAFMRVGPLKNFWADPATGAVDNERKKLLFVCRGNTCRSLMAEAMAGVRLQQLGIAATVRSVGTLGIEGKPPAPRAVIAMRDIGHDISEHVSRAVTLPIAAAADYLIIMQPEHRAFLEGMSIPLKDKIVALWDTTQNSTPALEELEDFVRCRDQIMAALERWLPLLAVS